MEVVSCYCKKCDSEVGRFRNSWIGIGNTYFSPSYPPLSVDGIQATGDVYDAARDSQIQDSVLQDIACEKCNEIFGLRCDKAPEGHLLKKDQLILRLSEMSVLSDSSGKKAKISILKTHPLTYAPGLRRTSGERVPSPTTSPRRSVPVSLIPSELVSREPSPAQPRPVTPPAIDLAKFKSWAEAAISDQKKDIDRLTGTVDRLERDMRSFKEFMLETRAELSSSSRVPLIEDNTEMRSLREELENLRQKVDQNGGLMTRGTLDIARSVDVVVEDVKRISQKTDEVDLLKAQLTEMQSHIQSLETKQNSMTIYNPAGRRSSALDKRKYDDEDQEYTIEEVQRMDATLAKRRKVSGATFPSASSPNDDRLVLDAGRDRYHTPAPEIIEVPSSSGLGLSPGLFVQQDGFDTSDFGLEDFSNIPDVPSFQATSNDHREQITKSSTVRVEINSFLKPSMMMPLQNGTIFNAGSRNDLLEVSHIEAATGHKRDQNGRWISAQDQRLQPSVRRQDGNNPKLSAVFANGFISNSNVNEQDQERRRTLRPRKERPTTGFEIYDGPGDDTWTPDNDDNGEEEAEDGEENHQNHGKENIAETVEQSSGTRKKPTVTVKTNYAGFSSLSAFSRAKRENTVPPIEWPGAIEASDKLALPQFYKCGTCNKSYRTLQALDYHHEHSEYCRKGANDVVPEAFKCGSCRKLFKSFTGIKDHMRKKICLNGGTPRRRASSSLLKCEMCDKKFKSEGQLNEHLCFPRGGSVMPSNLAAQAAQALEVVETAKATQPTQAAEAGAAETTQATHAADITEVAEAAMAAVAKAIQPRQAAEVAEATETTQAIQAADITEIAEAAMAAARAEELSQRERLVRETLERELGVE